MPLSAFISTDTSSPVAIHIVVKGASTSGSTCAIETKERPTSAASVSSTGRTATNREELPIRPDSASAPPAAVVVAPEPAVAVVPAAVVPPPVAEVPAASAAEIPAPAPPMPPMEQPASSSKQTDQPTTTVPPPTSPFPPGMESYYSNQMAYGVAYQAAYQAALQSIIAVQQQTHQQQQHHQNTDGAGGSNQQQPPPGQQMFYPMPMHMPFASPMPFYNYYNPYQYNPMMQPPPQQHQMQQGMDLRQRRRAAVVAAVAGGPDGRIPEDLIRRLIELRNRGFQLPPELVAALEREEAHGGGAAGGAAAGVGGARAPRVHRFQLRIQINIRALLQLAVMLVVVYQHCPPKRFAVLCLLGFALWLSTTPRVRAFLQQIAGLGQNNNNRRGVEVPVAAPVPAALAADGQPAVQADGGGAATPLDPQVPADQQQINQPRAGILAEIHAFVAGFITSLLPAMDQNNNDDGGAVRDVFGGEQ